MFYLLIIIIIINTRQNQVHYYLILNHIHNIKILFIYNKILIRSVKI